MLEGSFSYSVAIRTLGKAGDMFSRLIYSLKSQTIPPSGIYVYIAEGYELPKRVADERYIYCAKGMVHQRALPFNEITTEYILLCDDDIEFKEGAVMKLFDALEEHDGDCVSPNLFPNHTMSLRDNPCRFIWGVSWYHQKQVRVQDPPQRVLHIFIKT